MSLVNIGVLGCASIACRSVIPAIINSKNQYVLSGIASRTKEKAEKFASIFNTNSYHNYETLINNTEINAVYIPLPNSLHAKWVEKALSKNLHVLVEKSMGCSYEEVNYLNKLAKGKGLVLVENFMFRFHSQLSIINKLVGKKRIGELRCVRSSFGFPPFSENDNIRYKKELGGGALFDAGAYPIKIMQHFLGEDIQITSANLYYDKDKGVDIWGGAYLKQKNGPLFGEVSFGFDNFYQCNLELWGSEGKIYTNRIFTAPPDYSPEIIIESANGNDKICVDPCNHFERILSHFFKLIKTSKGLEAEYAQNISQARLIQEARKISSEDNKNY